MRTILKYSLTAFLLLLSCAVALAQTDRKEVRAGNRQFKKGNWQNAEIEYRKAQVKDSSSFAANYNLAGALYREGNFDEAGKSLGRLKDAAPVSANSADYYYNLGNIAVQKKDWKAAVRNWERSSDAKATPVKKPGYNVQHHDGDLSDLQKAAIQRMLGEEA